MIGVYKSTSFSLVLNEIIKEYRILSLYRFKRFRFFHQPPTGYTSIPFALDISTACTHIKSECIDPTFLLLTPKYHEADELNSLRQLASSLLAA